MLEVHLKSTVTKRMGIRLPPIPNLQAAGKATLRFSPEESSHEVLQEASVNSSSVGPNRDQLRN